MRNARIFICMMVVALALVPALSSTRLQAVGNVEFRVAPDDVKSGGYEHSDTITIQIYATGFYEDYPFDTIGYMDIAAIKTDNGGMASAPVLHPKLEGLFFSAGTIVNSGGVLIEDIRGSITIGDFEGVTPFPAVLHSFEFHIPDLPHSSIITLGLDGLSLRNVGFFPIEPAFTVAGPLEIHVISTSGPLPSPVAVDIKPGSCPNPLNVKSNGVLPVAILGTEDVNVIDIDPFSIRLADVNAIRCGFEDVAALFLEASECTCTEDGADGFLDLTLKFKTQDIAAMLGQVSHGDELVLTLTGNLYDGTPIEGADCVLIRGKHRP